MYRHGFLEYSFVVFYVQLATQFSVRIRRICRRGARRYAALSGTALTALTIHRFKAEKLSIAFTRFAARFFA